MIVLGYIKWAIALIRGTLIGKIVVGGLALLAAWKINNYYVAQQAVSRVIEKSKDEGRKANAKSAQIREQVRRTPGSADRLPCRDCD